MTWSSRVDSRCSDVGFSGRPYVRVPVTRLTRRWGPFGRVRDGHHTLLKSMLTPWVVRGPKLRFGLPHVSLPISFGIGLTARSRVETVPSLGVKSGGKQPPSISLGVSSIGFSMCLCQVEITPSLDLGIKKVCSICVAAPCPFPHRMTSRF